MLIRFPQLYNDLSLHLESISSLLGSQSVHSSSSESTGAAVCGNIC